MNLPTPSRGSERQSSMHVRAPAHERAFRRWSLPAVEEVSPAVDSNPASFRVYSPDELRSVPLRPAYRPAPAKGLTEDLSEGLAGLGTATPSSVLRWLGLGAAIGTLVLTAFVLVLNLTDDPRVTLTQTTSRLAAPKPPLPASVGTTSTAARIGTADTPAPNDFELPDDAQPGTARAARARAAKANKPKLAVRDVPF